MSGWLTNGVPTGNTYTGNEQASFDTENASGKQPQTISLTVQQLATLSLFYNNRADLTTVSGSRYYGSYSVGIPSTITGISVLVGGTGGTDLWIFELHDSTGALVATTTTSGTTAGTAGAWQSIAFTTPYSAAAGTYFITLQSNGTTAHPAVYNSPTSPLLTGSATGVFATGASITPPTTYTAAKAPVAVLY